MIIVRREDILILDLICFSDLFPETGGICIIRLMDRIHFMILRHVPIPHIKADLDQEDSHVAAYLAEAALRDEAGSAADVLRAGLAVRKAAEAAPEAAALDAEEDNYPKDISNWYVLFCIMIGL